MHASFRTPNLKARLNAFREEFHAVWRNYSGQHAIDNFGSYIINNQHSGNSLERKAHLQQLHAESQRLLRETRGVFFKPVPLVQNTISSILERIRQRKLEICQRGCARIQIISRAQDQ